MFLHCDTVLPEVIAECAENAGVTAHFTVGRSRSRRRRFDLSLEGDAGRAARSGHAHYPAATWDQWGTFLAQLYAVEPTMIVGSAARPVYSDADDFHWLTGGRFERFTPANPCPRHRWEAVGIAATGSYRVARCTKCAAVRRSHITR